MSMIVVSDEILIDSSNYKYFCIDPDGTLTMWTKDDEEFIIRENANIFHLEKIAQGIVNNEGYVVL